MIQLRSRKRWSIESTACTLAFVAVLMAAPFNARGDEDSRAKITAEQRELFESRIRPLLVMQCYECHNSSGTAEGGLALDHRAALLKGGDSGAVVVPGRPAESRLLQVVRHELEGLEMPQGAPKLRAPALKDIERWIAAGAPDPRDAPPAADELAEAISWEAVREKRSQWWSFQPIRRPSVPEVKDASWSQHPIDRFILARLEKEGLTPSGEADRLTLLRRLTFALTGLPPSPSQVESFLQDTSGDAYDRLVEQLLQSPRFGERWARHWMDWIRYAESHGSEGDPAIEGAELYRDYLIRALNDDVPYDQLVREHVAGDLLETPRINSELGINESLLGTAHWRMVFHGFAPTDALDEKVRFTDDQINTFTKAFLGLTVSCARCHNHKFDPISQRDYYALFGILGSCRPGRATLELPEQLDQNRERLQALKPRIREALAADWTPAVANISERLLQRDQGLVNKAEQADSLLHDWFLVQRDADGKADVTERWNERRAAWQDLRERRARSADVVRRWNLADPEDYGQWFAYGNGLPERPSKPGGFAVATDTSRGLTGIYPSSTYSHSLSTRHAARLTSPEFHLDDEYELWLRVAGDGEAMVRYVVQNYPRSGTVYPVPTLNGKAAARWHWQRFDLSYWKGDDVHIELTAARDAPLLVREPARSWFAIREAMLVKKGQPGPPDQPRQFLDPVFQLESNEPVESLHDVAERYERAVETCLDAWRAGEATDAQALLLDKCLRDGLLPNDLEQLSNAGPLLREYRRLESEVPVATRIPTLAEAEGRDQPLFERGDHKQPGELVPRRFLEVIDATPYQTAVSGRRQLAEDLLRPDNPLTRRVIVNRLWHHLFGRGLVATPDNFGSMGEQPTHPELLDYLAVEFSEQDWSLKQLMRLMVTSRTWRLSSEPSDAARRQDPDNRWISHAHVRRLEAEAIRDAMLAVSGSLNGALYGPSVSGTAPRRSIYIRVRRNSLDPFLRAFDFPEPFSATGRRDVTNVPAQALTMMNDTEVHKLAEAWAGRVLADKRLLHDEQRVHNMFLSGLGRPATSDEVARVLDYLHFVRREQQRLLAAAVQLRQEIQSRQQGVEQLLRPVRQRLLDDAKQNGSSSLAQPAARWEFDEDLRDAIGTAHAVARDGARLEDGALVLDGRGYAITAPLGRDLKEKTLEAWVLLDNLDQRGGGVISVQTRDGGVFDSLVYGEQSPAHWLAGSNYFARTRSLNGQPETEASGKPIHLALVYHSDGRISAYREGRPYGEAYKKADPVTFAAGETVVSFGLRHLPPSPGKMLRGRILRAQLYDRALSDDQILASSGDASGVVPERLVVGALTEPQRDELARRRAAIEQLKSEVEMLGPIPEPFDEQQVWSEWARAMFCLKEFIYLR